VGQNVLQHTQMHIGFKKVLRRNSRLGEGKAEQGLGHGRGNEEWVEKEGRGGMREIAGTKRAGIEEGRGG